MAMAQIEMSRREVYRWAEKKLRLGVYAFIEILMLALLIWIVVLLQTGKNFLAPSLAIVSLLIFHFFSEMLLYPWIVLKSAFLAAAAWFISDYLFASLSPWGAGVIVYSITSFIYNEMQIYRRASMNFSHFMHSRKND